MRLSQVSASKTFLLITLLGLIGLLPTYSAQPIPGRAEVRAVKGVATYSTNDSVAKPLRVGTVLRSGHTIKTATNSTVDLFLGASTGVIRIAENTTLTLDLLTLTDTGAEVKVDVQLDLPDGEMYFNVNKLSKPSRYEIKMPTGVAGIRGTKGSFCSRPGSTKPPVVLLQGTLNFIHVGPGGQLSSFRLSAPPPVYFTPGGGVQEATAEMILLTTTQVEAVTKTTPAPTTQPPAKQSNQKIEPVTTPH